MPETRTIRLEAHGARERREAGFTLVELLIVVVVIGILAAIAIPNFARMRSNAVRASCISSQRNVVQAATLYALENGVSDAVINCSTLRPGGYLNAGPSECPASPVKDYDDYTITIAGQRVTNIRCDMLPAQHDWSAY